MNCPFWIILWIFNPPSALQCSPIVIVEFDPFLPLHWSNWSCAFHVKPHQNEPSNVDHESSQPKFGWSPTDINELAFDVTDQFHCTSFGAHLKKHFRSPCLACNLEHHEEPIATNTAHSDAPVVDNRAKVAQIHVGTMSGALNVCMA